MANAILRGKPNARNLQRMVLWGAHRQNRGKGVRICGNAISAVFVVAGALLAGQLSAGEKPWTEGPLTVDKGDVVNLNGNSKTNWFEGTAAGVAVTLHGDMNVAQTSVKRSTGWAVFVMENGVPQEKSPYIELAPDAGDSGVLTLDGAYLNTYYSNSMRGYLNIGSNGGGEDAMLVLKNGSSADLNRVDLRATATTTKDVFDVLEIVDSTLTASYICNSQQQKPMRIRFSGDDPCIMEFFTDNALFNTSNGGDVILDGVGESPIAIKNSSSCLSLQLFGAADKFKGKVRTTGSGDVVFGSAYSKSTARIRINRPCFEWGHAGDLRLVKSKAVSLRVEVSDALPFGPNTGNVRIEGGDGYVLDLWASQKLNGLVLAAGSSLVATNAAVTLTFGTDDASGVLGGDLTGTEQAVSLVKVGSGTLLVASDTLVGNFTVNDGRVVVSNCTLTCSRLDTVSSGAIECVDGGRVMAAAGDAHWVLPSVAADHEAIDSTAFQAGTIGIEYMGTLMATFLKGGTFSDVTIGSGTLRMGGECVEDKYWRVTVRKANAGNLNAKWGGADTPENRSVSLAIGRLHILDGNGQLAVKSGSYVADKANVTAAWGSNYKFMDSLKYLGWSFGTASQSIGFCTDELDGTAEKSITITFEAEKMPVCSYGFSSPKGTNVGHPDGWVVESSSDKENWTLRDTRVGQADVVMNNNDTNYGNGGHPYFLGASASDWSFVVQGAVSVANGATLDLDEIPVENIAIGSLAIDVTAGAGTITRFVPGGNGKLYLASLPEDWYVGGSIARMHELPLTVNDISDEENFSGWELYVDGARVKNGRVEWKNGKLRAGVPSGLMILFR